MTNKYYIKYAISPVQEFIEASMTKKDMWASSYLISYIAASVMYRLSSLKVEADFVYPKFEESNFKKLLNSGKFLKVNAMPNLPNTFLASFKVDEEDEEKANEVLDSLNSTLSETLKVIADKVEKYMTETYPNNSLNKELFDAQVKVMFSSQYFLHKATDKKDIDEIDMEETEKYFAYYKNTRAFNAWNNASSWSLSGLGSDSLNGKEEAVTKFGGEAMGASTLFKRFFFDAYIDKTYTLGEGVSELFEEKFRHFEQDGESYYAMLMLDGDNMGKLLSSEIELAGFTDKKTQLDLVSNNLTTFSGEKVESVVIDKKGVLIYSGGDDVFALLPIENAIACIEDIRETFKGLFEKKELIDGKYVDLNDEYVDVSCGLSIAHTNAYLSHIVHSTRQAEKRAKNDVGRKAVAISLIKRSGEIVEADFKLDSPVLGLYKDLLKKITAEELAKGFANKLLNVLNDYVPMSKDYEYNIDGFFKHSNDVLKLEFANALDRDDFLAKLKKPEREVSKLEIINKFNEIFTDKEPKKLWEEFASMLQFLAWIDGR